MMCFTPQQAAEMNFIADRGEPAQRDRLSVSDLVEPAVHADRAAAAPHRHRPRPQGLPHLPRVHRHFQATGEGGRTNIECVCEQGKIIPLQVILSLSYLVMGFAKQK